jgi:SAM-dependent methyltransferase
MIDRRAYLSSDERFNDLFPGDIRKFSTRHWTPLHIVNACIEFLGEPGCKILDIGSGVGKFCLAAAWYAPQTHFYGIEQRANFVGYAENARAQLGISNVSFINGNFTQLDLTSFDHFYCYNSFYENIDPSDRIDDGIEYSAGLFDYYSNYLATELRKMPVGTKIVTYHSLREVPIGYELVQTLEYGDLNFWVKK